MTFPAGYTARVAVPADIEPMLAVLHAGDAELLGEPDTPRDFVEEVFVSPFLDPSLDVLLVEDAAGTVVACADVQAANPASSVDAFVRVHPGHTGRGIASALLDRLEARARERADGQATRFQASTDANDASGVALLHSRGGEHVRTFLHMQGPSDGVTGAPSPPDGVTFRAFRHDEGDDWATFHRVLEAAFADHFGAEPLELDTFVTMWTENPSWDPALVTFAEVDGEVVGIVVGSVTANPGLGWINDLGVLQPFRGRGIAKALLLRSFAQLAARGCTDVRLAVDSENTTGATRLYEAVGMGVQRRWDLYEKRLEPAH